MYYINYEFIFFFNYFINLNYYIIFQKIEHRPIEIIIINILLIFLFIIIIIL